MGNGCCRSNINIYFLQVQMPYQMKPLLFGVVKACVSILNTRITWFLVVWALWVCLNFNSPPEFILSLQQREVCLLRSSLGSGQCHCHTNFFILSINIAFIKTILILKKLWALGFGLWVVINGLEFVWKRRHARGLRTSFGVSPLLLKKKKE